MCISVCGKVSSVCLIWLLRPCLLSLLHIFMWLSLHLPTCVLYVGTPHRRAKLFCSREKRKKKLFFSPVPFLPPFLDRYGMCTTPLSGAQNLEYSRAAGSLPPFSPVWKARRRDSLAKSQKTFIPPRGRGRKTLKSRYVLHVETRTYFVQWPAAEVYKKNKKKILFHEAKWKLQGAYYLTMILGSWK